MGLLSTESPFYCSKTKAIGPRSLKLSAALGICICEPHKQLAELCLAQIAHIQHMGCGENKRRCLKRLEFGRCDGREGGSGVKSTAALIFCFDAHFFESREAGAPQFLLAR
jgi:hypothetical protein